MKKAIVSGGLVLCLIAACVLVAANHHSNKPKPATTPHQTYIALGDSVAAGLGLENYSDSSACDRTNQAYPDQVATALHLRLKNLACSGATLSAGILGPQNVNQLLVAAQLQQLFALPRPDLITLTIGANDIEWTTFIAKCYSGQCATASDTAAINSLLATVSLHLQGALSQIQSHYKSDVPHVIVTGYHQVFPTGTATCSDLTGIDSNELAWGRQQQTNLNTTISTVVSKFSFAKFAAIGFSGHELCTADSWVQGIDDTAPYHPTEAGQAVYAKQILATNALFK